MPHKRRTIRPPSNSYSIDATANIRPRFIDGWPTKAACHGRWDEFDGVRKETRAVCWNECTVRKECLASSLAFEKEMESRPQGADHEFGSGTGRRYWRHGTRGGYKPGERARIAAELARGADMTAY
jgi:hypothetical protein